VLYEGLPHQYWEEEQLEKELASKSTVRLQDFPFYEQPLPLTPDEATKLLNVIRDDDLYKPPSPPKKCGGFHPDYAVQWESGSTRYLVMICFGCGELRRVGPDGVERFDMGPAAKTLGEILGGRRQNRPPKLER
jgi:hypothetical protein